MTTNTTSSAVTVLALLDAYQQQHDNACCHWKDTLLNLTKARRDKGEFLGASDIRQQVRPRAVVMTTTSEPNLVSEEEDNSRAHDDVTLVLVDPVQEKDRMMKRETKQQVLPSNDSSSKQGLRRRKQSLSSKTSPWTTVQEEDHDNEETRLCHADPLDLFGGGLNPRALQQAQEQAQQMLAAYVRAANLKLALEHELDKSSKKK